jgi:hypothetical protein
MNDGSGNFERLYRTMPVDTSSLMSRGVAEQKLLTRRCKTLKCSRCGRAATELEADTGLCLVCIGRELEL